MDTMAGLAKSPKWHVPRKKKSAEFVESTNSSNLGKANTTSG